MRKRMRRAVVSILLVVCMLALSGCGGQRMMMGTGGTAGTYYAFGGVLAQYMKNYTGYSVTAVSTAASKANIQSIGDGDYQMGFTQSDVMTYAWEGSKSFETDGPCRDFRVLGALYAETVQLITMKEDIKTHNQYAKMFSENIPAIKQHIADTDRRLDNIERRMTA